MLPAFTPQLGFGSVVSMNAKNPLHVKTILTLEAPRIHFCLTLCSDEGFLMKFYFHEKCVIFTILSKLSAVPEIMLLILIELSMH